jgi:hypothetical protein
MVQAWLGRIAANILLIALLAASAPMGTRAQGAADLDTLDRQMVQLYG